MSLRDALDAANIPTLLLVLRHLSGDPRWLAQPYLPRRTIAMNDNDTGGFDDARQAEIRAAALELLEGPVPVPGPPSDEEIIEWLSASLGERVPDEYGDSMAEEGGFRLHPAFSGEPVGDRRVLVIGAGMSGICAAVALRRAGAEFTVLERGTEVGGTWRDNDYPGAGVDTPSHLYTFSFAPEPGWTRYYAKQPDILAYLRRVARDEDVERSVEFGVEVVGAQWDEASRTWTVRARDGSERTADVLISSVGQLNAPVVPPFPGLDTFPGPAFHTAQWDHSVSLAGKRVGIVGTGASAIQVLPGVAAAAASTVVFQRSPQWVAPNDNYLRDVDPRVRALMARVPGYRAWYRLRLMWMFQDKLHPTLQKDDAWAEPSRSLNAVNDKHRVFFTRYLRAQLGDREDLVAATLPDYPPYGKRMLLDYDWFQTLRRPDVELVKSGVAAVEGDVVVTDDGGRHQVDVVVFATGFAARRMLAPMEIRGRGGVSLRELWGADDAWAHLGITVPGFPNLFLLYGPNTNLGHGGSTMFHAECQVGYVMALLRSMTAEGIAAVEVRDEVCAEYVRRVDAAHERMIWTHPGMRNWYRNAAGRVVTNTPWRLIDYRAMTRSPDLAEYHIEKEVEHDAALG